jgi:anaerobic selenocysteine-containing dehydrogenase
MLRLAGDAMASDRGTRQDDWAGLHPDLAALAVGEAWPEDGFRLALPNRAVERFKSLRPAAAAAGPDELQIVLVERTFGTEDLSSYSACLAALQDEPFAALHPKEAEALGVRDGDRIAVPSGAGPAVLAVKVFDHMATGVMVVPRLRRPAWQMIGQRIRRQDVRKA